MRKQCAVYLQSSLGLLKLLYLEVDIVSGGGDVGLVGRDVEVETAQVLPYLVQQASPIHFILIHLFDEQKSAVFLFG